MFPEVYNELGIGADRLPPAVFVDEGSGGLKRTNFGWVIEIPSGLDEIRKIAYYLHCVGHYILEHYMRRPKVFADDKLWDLAADYAANSLMMLALARSENRKIKSARSYLYPYSREYEGLSAEAIYISLMEKGRKGIAFGDSHSDFSEGGETLPSNVTEVGAVDLKILGAGEDRNAVLFRTKVKEVAVPPDLQSFFAQSFSYDEVLDILFVPYGRYWTLETPAAKFHAYHCVDVSASMAIHLNDVMSLVWALVNFIYSYFGGRAHQKVSLVDVEERYSWVGSAPDEKLYAALSCNKGLGGTTYSYILAYQLENNLPDCLIIYSDLMFSEGTATYRWNYIVNEIVPKIAVTVLVSPDKVSSRWASKFKYTLNVGG